MEALLVVIAVAGMFLLLIAPHEAGHFALAKLFKVRVIEFSIGAGTKLWSTTRGGTLYAIRAIPVIGYVRMGGMEAGDFEDPSGFHHKTPWQRILILAAGPAANFVVAILLFTGLGLTQLNDDVGKVARVVPNSPAAAAGFQAGDRLRSVEGQPITAPDQLRKVENAAPNAAIVVAAQSASLGPGTYIFFVALLSVALGFTTLLPFLALDGGRMAVVLIEVLRRRPFDRTSELNFQRIGLVALLGLAAVISFLDIQRIATGQFPGLQR